MTFINPNIAIVAGAAVRSATSETRQNRRKGALEQTVQLGREYVEIVRRAQKENPEDRPEIIQWVKELLLKGHFDSRQAAREAAQKIVEYGV